MMKTKTFDLYDILTSDSVPFTSIFWDCPLCYRTASIRKNDAEYSISFMPTSTNYDLGIVRGNALIVVILTCPSCNKKIVQVGNYSNFKKNIPNRSYDPIYYEMDEHSQCIEEAFVYPFDCRFGDIKTFSHVPELLVNDYEEVAKLVHLSPNAAVAFGRRCIERLILHKWPEVRDTRQDRKVPRLSEMIAWLRSEHPEVNSTTLDAIKVLGDKAIHIFDAENDVAFTYDEAVLVKQVIEDFLIKFFEEEEEKNIRERELQKLTAEVKEKAKAMESLG